MFETSCLVNYCWIFKALFTKVSIILLAYFKQGNITKRDKCFVHLSYNQNNHLSKDLHCPSKRDKCFVTLSYDRNINLSKDLHCSSLLQRFKSNVQASMLIITFTTVASESFVRAKHLLPCSYHRDSIKFEIVLLV